eukprot:CAMPEP_0119132752 /NCGR_PEP_ID=MMETSP1310-20130426/12244_1 /TAXON_ID=464262 /ORGANISM="Genus nov. species nov., Strain RCC2339" /LENGTH=108 /DNA_ID=CAMNT_0007123405 /DNA_START=55 /DNA_END=381 /DNA_ORIENTATION=-
MALRVGARESLNTQLEHLQMKYVGTGHADTTKYEWLCNQRRDSFASYIGHESMLHYFAIAQNESIARVRVGCLDKMARPCGDAPEVPANTLQLAVAKQAEASEEMDVS